MKKIKRNRKKKNERMYKIIGLVSQKDEEIARKTREAGKFILGTNLVEENKLEPTEILITYKNQQSTERGFRFLKDPLFFTDSFFVENPERIETMLFLKEAGVERQEAGGRLEGDSDPPLNEDRQI